MFVGGDQHASVEVISLALGHWIWVPATQAAAASAVIRESGHLEIWVFSTGLRRALLRLIAFWIGWSGSMVGVGVWIGVFPLWTLSLPALHAATIPVNAQGRGDYFLVEADS